MRYVEFKSSMLQSELYFKGCPTKEDIREFALDTAYLNSTTFDKVASMGWELAFVVPIGPFPEPGQMSRCEVLYVFKKG